MAILYMNVFAMLLRQKQKTPNLVDMPLHSKRIKRRHKGILHSRNTRKKRGRRVRFVGGMVGNVWMDTPIGPMKKKEYDQYQQQLSPEPY